MKRFFYTLLLGQFLLSACSLPDIHLPTPPSVVPSETSVENDPGNPVEMDIADLSPDELASLESLEKLDEYPLYSMRYLGSYPIAKTISSSAEEWNIHGEGTSSWACSLFSAFADRQGSLYGRNFDWDYSPALLLFTDPPNGFASVSMVDIAYLGFEENLSLDLESLPASKLLGLLEAPNLPFDGMNESGLAVGMAAVPESEPLADPERETLDSLMVIRLVLDKARNVEEALEIFRQYNLDWGSGPALHYLIADRTGRSALVEYWEGEMVVIENDADWQAATNFLQSVYGDRQRRVCWRFDRMVEQLTSASEKFSADDALNLLADVSQSNTQWSVVYGLADGSVRVVMGRAYEKINLLWQAMLPAD